MIKEICKAKSLDVLLQSWRDLSLISPEFITLQLNTEGGEDGLYLPQAFMAMFSSALGRCSAISVVFQRYAMEKKNSLFGEIGDIAASLSENLKSSSVESAMDIIIKDLDKAFSCIIIIIYILSKLVKECGSRRSH
jgi:hypothetical protein